MAYVHSTDRVEVHCPDGKVIQGVITKMTPEGDAVLEINAAGGRDGIAIVKIDCFRFDIPRRIKVIRAKEVTHSGEH